MAPPGAELPTPPIVPVVEPIVPVVEPIVPVVEPIVPVVDPIVPVVDPVDPMVPTLLPGVEVVPVVEAEPVVEPLRPRDRELRLVVERVVVELWVPVEGILASTPALVPFIEPLVEVPVWPLPIADPVVPLVPVVWASAAAGRATAASAAKVVRRMISLRMM